MLPTNNIHYLTPADLYTIAEEVLERKPEVRDRHLLRKAAARPMLVLFGEEVFPTLCEKAAALLHSLAAHHLFYDGNKRTATAATIRFLQLNGWHPTWDAESMYDFVLAVAQNKYEVSEIADWLSAHTVPQRPMIRYLTLDELIYINEQVSSADRIHKILKGKQRVRDMGLLEAAIGRPMLSAFGEDAYPTLAEKAAAMLHSLARNHPFTDGNKRTATLAALFMLVVNGQRVTWTASEALDHIVHVAEGQSSVTEFARWLTIEPGGPSLPPDAETDKQIIARLAKEHAWLLDELSRH